MKKIIFSFLLTIVVGYLYAQNIQKEEVVQNEYVEQEDFSQSNDYTGQNEDTNQNQSIILDENENLEEEQSPADDYNKGRTFDYDDRIDKLKQTKKNDLADNNIKTKSSWYIGFGLGSGLGRIEGTRFDKVFDSLADLPGVYKIEKSTPVTINFGVGGIINPNLHIGLDISAIYQDATYYESGYHNIPIENEMDFLITNMLCAVTYYPKVTGFSLKGGVGISSFDYSASNIGAFGDDFSGQYSGYAFLIGVGYDFWLGDTFNLGLHLEFSRQKYKDFMAPKNTDFINAYVSLYWF